MGQTIRSTRAGWTLVAALMGPMALTAAVTVPLDGPTRPDVVAGEPPVTATSTGFQDKRWGDDATREDEKASAETGNWKADKDYGSLYTAGKWYRAQDAWHKTGASGSKITGKGVDVALIDTGVAPVAGLNTDGKVLNGPDLSFESQDPSTRYLDGYGHGTHMAGIIAGRDAGVAPGKEDDDHYFVGIAPDARIVNVKVATADGGADVSQIIAAIDWVVQHRNDAGMNIRVINLSYGTHSTQPYTVDPLAYAAENAWRKGIVVVAAAGNDGSGKDLTMPAADPHVLAVGAVDHVGSKTRNDDRTASFTNSGTTARRADLLAPGKSVVSLRVPGSYADRGHPEGLVTGDDTARFFRGSGTSQATAMVSGAVALLLQQRPELTPDQVKYLLTSSADPLKVVDAEQRAGVLNVKEAIEAATPSAQDAQQVWAAATGTGTLEGSRGDSHVVDPQTGTMLTGEIDALGNPFVARSWRDATAMGQAWTGGEWNGREWSGSDWSGSSWTARSWRSASWSGGNWSGGDWSARSWRGDTWTASGWSSLDIATRSWSQDAWTARSWRDYGWNADDAW